MKLRCPKKHHFLINHVIRYHVQLFCFVVVLVCRIRLVSKDVSLYDLPLKKSFNKKLVPFLLLVLLRSLPLPLSFWIYSLFPIQNFFSSSSMLTLHRIAADTHHPFPHPSLCHFLLLLQPFFRQVVFFR